MRALNPAAARFLRDERLAERCPVSSQQPRSELTTLIDDLLTFERFLGTGDGPRSRSALRRIVTMPSGNRYRIEGSLRFENGLVIAAVLRASPIPDQPRLDSSQLARRWGFTAREIAVAQGLVTGDAAPALCRELAITPETLKSHLRNLFEKTQTHSRAGLLALLLRSATLS